MHKWSNIKLNDEEKSFYNKLIVKIQKWIIKKLKEANSIGVVIGVSGGVDSAALSIIAKRILGSKAFLYYLETDVDNETRKHVFELNNIVKDIQFINLKEEFELLSKKIEVKNDYVKANLKSRLFMSVLYAKAQENNSLVLGTDNYDEYYLGYFTKWGDGGCDLLPFANLLKSDIYKMAHLLSVPGEIIKKQPSANLVNTKSDEEELGFSYEEFEKYLTNETLVSKQKALKIRNIHLKTAHKRNSIPKGPKK
ncbi:NAD(+) synthase [Mycoplasma enhydrae]|uniref:NAD(+) synthase n=1 Tax=Mycoplasma enhydrae TaxID=2499220 RepID=UPI00197B4EDD|nr:NAD(+) synthase [Mycoplasma enhydrae]MBN4089506.1 NAD(+) synthase [Mycoplasma enhydrae]MCV3733649.1 NAD(+) synthase [Mycoplasma enhydrae]MCV3753370.1 NAD(+) synthase [Mycoplasma enhydrae]